MLHRCLFLHIMHGNSMSSTSIPIRLASSVHARIISPFSPFAKHLKQSNAPALFEHEERSREMQGYESKKLRIGESCNKHRNTMHAAWSCHRQRLTANFWSKQSQMLCCAYQLLVHLSMRPYSHYPPVTCSSLSAATQGQMA